VLRDPEQYCVVQIAPAVRVALGEAFGFPLGANVTKKMYTALRRMGFKAIFDTNFAADVTIMEEASEFVERFVHKKNVLPLITTCCPSWVDFMEKFHGDMIPHFSSAKSPHEMMGVLVKTYYAEKNKIDPKKIKVISVMPCTSKKFEISRSREMSASGFQDVDVVLTTRELARMIKQAGIDLIWFGVYLVIHVEMAQITPPVGFNLFVLQNMSGRDTFTVARAAFPFFLLLIVAVFIITEFPQIVLVLPHLAFPPS
jgi:NADH-quinone oxidoreductase subunit G